ncbi:MAG: hypothetical protein R3A51_16310 [Nannocystaceae bacterium]
MRPLLALHLAALLCVGCTDAAKPETIVGVWIEQCRTAKPDEDACAGQGDSPFRHEFGADGSYAKTLNGFNACSTASWTQQGTSLELVCEGGGLSLRERWGARFVNGRLVLWDDELGGRVLVREGTAASGSKRAVDPDVPRPLGPLRYTVQLPADYYRGEATSVSEQFISDDPAALRFRLKYGHAARPVGERARCVGYSGQLSRDDDGAMRILCVERGDAVYTLSCWAQRIDEGPLTDAQFAAAERVCGSIRASVGD